MFLIINKKKSSIEQNSELVRRRKKDLLLSEVREIQHVLIGQQDFVNKTLIMATLPSALHLITLLPPVNIRVDIKEMKKEIKSRFSSSHALKLPAHITLQSPFWVKETDSILLKDRLRNFSREQKPFPIVLDDFGCFPPRVIFVKISNSEPIVQLHAHLQNELPSSLFLDGKQRQLNIHPHLTLATRDLQENIFHQAWAAFKERSYQADFIVDELTLFRHNGKTWRREESFPFATI